MNGGRYISGLGFFPLGFMLQSHLAPAAFYANHHMLGEVGGQMGSAARQSFIQAFDAAHNQQGMAVFQVCKVI